MDCEETNTRKPAAQCTDPLSLIAFVIFWCGMVLIIAFSATFGDLQRLISGADSFGNACGRENTRVYPEMDSTGLDLNNKPYLFSLDEIDPFNSLWLCIERCPSARIETRQDLLALAVNQGVHACLYDVLIEEYATDRHNFTAPSTSVGPCPMMPFSASLPFRGRCVPIDSRGRFGNTSISILQYMDYVDFLQRFMGDLIECWPIVSCICALAFVLSTALILAINYWSSGTPYLVFALVVIGSASNSVSLWWTYAENGVDDSLNQISSSNGSAKPLLLVSARCNRRMLLAYAIVSSVATVVLLGLCASSIRNLSLVRELFQHTSQYMRKRYKLLFLLMVPIATAILLAVLILLWAFITALLATADLPVAVNRQANWPYIFNVTVVEYKPLGPVKYFGLYLFFGFIWTAAFIIASQQFLISATVADWYILRRDRRSIWGIIQKLIGFHLGSMALGSVLLTLVHVPLSILSKITPANSRWDRWTCRVHHSAYAIIAIDETGLWWSMKTASRTIRSKSGQGFETIKSSGLIIFLGKCGVTAISSFVGILLLKDNPNLQAFIAPVLLIVVFSYLISHCVLTTCEVVTDALFLCYCQKVTTTRSVDTVDDAGTDGDDELNDFLERLCGSTKRNPAVASEAAEQIELSALNR